MPGLLVRNSKFVSSPPRVRSGSLDGIWSKHRDSITFDQLQKFWSELPLQARKELLKLDKQTLFEQARKNLYCSRCNGLLLEGFSQIMTYGKSLQQEGPGFQHSDREVNYQSQNQNQLVEVQDPSLHPWGGLTTTKHGVLTVLDCFICARSLKTLKNVFDSARAREHERELLYPDACSGGSRGWISQGLAYYGRGHGSRETCALHTTRFSCDTLVDFWSALGEETRSTLLRMKEEDFIERLMYRFDSKRFCRDCRKNVIREFKELKELKRVRKEPHCSKWFCVADSAFQYEVLEDTIHADWQQSFTDTVGTYHHFEWAIGTGEGQSDILEFEDVGMNGKVQVSGLDLGGLCACYITLRAWKLDGRCTELCVKAHALNGQDCVHHRLIIGDGFVTITDGDNIRKFFEHAEEAEEEEDDGAFDKDGNEVDGDGSRSQKHAESPEHAREFLLDAVTVIFKEQVEKAFREGAARQNAHCIFVCLALKLLEERLHVACKEIVTLEKQTKLLEEEEKEKRAEEERKERKKTKEREKKLRRKERLKEKDKERERKHAESKSVHEPPNSSGFLFSAYEKLSIIPHSPDSVTELTSILESTDSSDIKDEQYSDATPRIIYTIEQRSDFDGKYHLNSGKFSTSEYSKSMWRKLRNKNDDLLDQTPNWCGRRRCYIDRAGNNQQDEVDIRLCSFRGTNTLYKPSRERFVKHNNRSCVLKSNEKFHSSHARVEHRFDHQPCCSNQQDDYFEKDGYHNSVTRTVMEIKSTDRTERTIHMPRSFFCIVKHSSGCYSPEVLAISKGKHVGDSPGKEIQKKQVWEPLDAQKKFSNSKPDSKITSVCVTRVDLCKDISIDSGENGCQQTTKLESADGLDKVDSMNTGVVHKAQDNSDKFGFGTNVDCHNKLDLLEKSEYYSKNDIKEALTPNTITCSDLVRSSSSSDNCFSCLSEGDISTSSSAQNADSSVTSDSEDASQLSCGRDASSCNNGPFKKFVDEFPGCKDKTNLDASFAESATGFPFESYVECDFSGRSSVSSLDPNNKKFGYAVAPPLKHAIPLTNNNIHVPFIPPPTLCYHARNMDPWSASCNGFMPFSQVNYYVLPNHLGYGLPANRPLDFNMHYNNVQHVNVPVFDPSKQLFHQTSYNMNFGNLKDHEKHPNPCGFPPLHSSTEPTGSQSFHEKSYSDKLFPNPAGQNHNAEHYANAHNDHSSFSLFHFGGPVAGATTGSSTQLHSLKDEANRGFAYKLAAAQSSPKEEIKVEEYCLFSARNDARFSFF